MANLYSYLNREQHASPLAVFRIGFGLMMLLSIIRFTAYGWIDKLYLQPDFHFSYWGFEWVKPIGIWTYGIFLLCALSALAVALGYKYRYAIVLFFLSFTYIELMDKTTYLNHYYFISVLSFLMIFLPAHVYYSIDAYCNPEKRFEKVPQWTIDSLKLMLGIVYFYAGLAKLNSDWLFKAMPLQIWLPSKYSLPILGDLFQQTWMHYAFSWSGAIYDLTIPFLLLYKRTRPFAFFMVLVFHVLTRVLFPIGMFPYIMIISALIFFDADFHNRLLNGLSRLLKIPKAIYENDRIWNIKSPLSKQLRWSVLVTFFFFQLSIPFRYLAYPGELFWTEEGYRFSWRVMLMEKAGYAIFKIVDPQTKRQFYIDNSEFLNPFQEKQMSTQADFILEYAHFLAKEYQKRGIAAPEVYVDSYVALNGRRSQPYIDSTVDLSKIQPSFKHKTWILPFNDEIKGL